MAQIERQELHCHDCGKYIQFDLDLEVDGNHVLECPVCKHQHCRVVQKGKVSDIRWDNRNGSDKSKGDKPNPDGCQVLQGDVAPDKPKENLWGPSPAVQAVQTPAIGPNGLPIIWIPANNVTYSTQSTWVIYQGNAGGTTSAIDNNVFLYQAWMDTTAGTNYGNGGGGFK